MNPLLYLLLCALALLLCTLAIAGRLRKWRWARMAAEDRQGRKFLYPIQIKNQIQ